MHVRRVTYSIVKTIVTNASIVSQKGRYSWVGPSQNCGSVAATKRRTERKMSAMMSSIHQYASADESASSISSHSFSRKSFPGSISSCGALDERRAASADRRAASASSFFAASRRGRLDRGGTIRSARTYDSGNTPSRPPLRPRAHPDGASRSGQQTKTSPSASVRQRRSAVANASDERTTSTSSSPGLSRSSDSALPSEMDDPCRASDDVETTEAASAMAA